MTDEANGVSAEEQTVEMPEENVILPTENINIGGGDGPRRPGPPPPSGQEILDWSQIGFAEKKPRFKGIDERYLAYHHFKFSVK